MRVAILGGGPAGMTAAIYSARAGLKPVVIAPATGGQLMGKGVGVENYPGIMEANGGDIIKLMKSQAAKFQASCYTPFTAPRTSTPRTSPCYAPSPRHTPHRATPPLPAFRPPAPLTS